ncbi:hypothetical protein [Mangrovimonas sp. DI 80]|uniref:hypothetical protein n=1 Tax=Mangrovimonas sp. DI 80 TaxID=1779330 RepID=UPI000976A0D8|nr:hypothetical protein [Mangrovimonas sp. DI 80]OMP30160.1 hypothetical protein BKM32_12290 [Mangrovimonas sp. DI 80]
MKKHNILFLLLIAIIAISCENEDNLEPSYLDEDRVASQIDVSDPIINKWYTDLNMGVLYEYDSILDFAYVAGTSNQATTWARIEIPEIRTRFENEAGLIPADQISEYESYKASVTTFLDTALFKYFDASKTIANYMPYKVLISNYVYSPNSVSGEARDVLIESESRKSSSTEGDLRAVYNDHSIVFGVDLDEFTSESTINKYSKDAFYILVSRIISMHNLIDLIPAEFFEGKSEYYAQNMEAIYREETEVPDDKLVFVVDREWFYSKGFIDAKYFYNSPTGLTTFIQTVDEDGNSLSIINYIRHRNAIVVSYDFVEDELTDVRSYLSEMIHRNATEIEAFPENIQNNMKLLLDTFTSLGIDIMSVNPDLEVLN